MVGQPTYLIQYFFNGNVFLMQLCFYFYDWYVVKCCCCAILLLEMCVFSGDL